MRKKEVSRTSEDSNTVYVGRKPAMNYVLAVLTNFNSSETKEVTIKARGRAISTAVDVSEIVNRRFMRDLDASEITIGTEEVQQEEGGTRNVSTIEIKLARKREPSAKEGKAKIFELTEVKGVGPKTAGKLVEAGIKNANDLASSDPERVAEAVGSSVEKASGMIEDARSLVGR